MFKKKKILAPFERTVDTVPFEIPEIKEKIERKGYQKNHFVSPIFGTRVKDEVVIPNSFTRSGDLDRQLDTFRTKPKMSKADMKKKYGSEYPEFDLVSGSNLKDAMTRQEAKMSKKNVESFEDFEEAFEEESSFEEPVQQDEHIEHKPKTNINDFFGSERKKPKIDIILDDKPEPKNVTKSSSDKEYKLPPFSLLTKPLKKNDDSDDWIEKQIEILKTKTAAQSDVP